MLVFGIRNAEGMRHLGRRGEDTNELTDGGLYQHVMVLVKGTFALCRLCRLRFFRAWLIWPPILNAFVRVKGMNLAHQPPDREVSAFRVSVMRIWQSLDVPTGVKPRNRCSL